ncbi:GNAT family N-acetyltransferase [Arthrobacter livingstonensis]|uniref:GNAT family N-acetyltransferase n=1 Tax=Arthrobacter livingstonensis TaxID=670078 RepID=UPI001FEB8DC6|nr:hypothetical protein [Arthrobacter livingstonensis]
MSADIRNMLAADWAAVERIQAGGTAGGNATFADAPPMEDFSASRIPALRIAATDERGRVQGWAAATATSSREVYRGAVEHYVCVGPEAAGRGVGMSMLRELAERAYLRILDDPNLFLPRDPAQPGPP